MMESGSVPPKIFQGVRFVLLGFDPTNQLKFRSKLVDCGGVDVGQYSPNCTHLILHNVAYDHPVCVAARNSGKTVVTALWVDHSFDIGMPVEPTAIIYRPLKDLKGIPGSKNLVVCLTGYQRQDRDDIMTMVGLMGAQFSKPLVANKVTHLVCYKFEGEKYRLAQQLRRIKLVNHRWLEDCLRDWAILPEDNYNKSGYELEMLEAEARDSEDEAAEAVIKQSAGRGMNKSFHILNPCLPVPCQFPKLEEEAPIIPQNSMEKPSPGNKTKSEHNSNFSDICLSKVPSPQDACKFKNATVGELNDCYRTSPNEKAKDDLVSISGTADMTSYSDRKLSNSRQSPYKSTLPLYLGDKSGHGSGSSTALSHKLNVNDDLPSSSFRVEANDKIDSKIVEAPFKGTHLQYEEDSSGILPQKRTPDHLYASSKLQKTGYDAKLRSPSSVTSLKEKPESLVGGSCKTTDYYVDRNDTNSLDETVSAGVSAAKSSTVTKKSSTYDLLSSPTLISEIGQGDNANEKTPLSTFQRLRKSTIKPGIVGFGMGKSTATVTEIVEPQDKHQDAEGSSISNKNLESNNFGQANMVKGGTDDSPKMLAKKTLGCRPKLTSENEKCSVYMDERASSYDATVHLNAGYQEKSSTAVNLDLLSPEVNVEAMKRVEGKDVNMSEDVPGNKIDPMDDETEAPEDEDQIRLDTVMAEKSVGIASIRKDDTVLEEISEGVQHISNCSRSGVHGDTMDSVKNAKETEQEETVPLLVESSSKGNAAKQKNSGKKRSLGKTKLKTVPATADQMNSDKGVSEHISNHSDPSVHGDAMASVENMKGNEQGKTVSVMVESTSEGDTVKQKHNSEKKRQLGKTMLKTVSAAADQLNSEKGVSEHISNQSGPSVHGDAVASVENMNGKTVSVMVESTSKGAGAKRKKNKEKKLPVGKTKLKTVPAAPDPVDSDKDVSEHLSNHSNPSVHGDAMASGENMKGKEQGDNVSVLESTSKGDGSNRKKTKQKKLPLGNTKLKTVPAISDKKGFSGEEAHNGKIVETEMEQEKELGFPEGKTKCHISTKNKIENSSEMKENRPVACGDKNISKVKKQAGKSLAKSNLTPLTVNQKLAEIIRNPSILEGNASNIAKTQPVWFILSGHQLQRKEFQKIIKRLKGKCCRDSHNWSYQATHFILPEPVRRIEKFFAAAASGRWILKSDYLAASNQVGKFVAEEPYEWYKSGLSEDGAVNLEAPRKWRLLRERTGHGALHGMRIIIYGDCIAPSLDTLKRVVKAGDGMILATCPPYTRFLTSVVDFAIVSPGMPHGDMWVQEFLKHEIPCVVADYLVEYVCKPGYPLERHVLYNTHAWAEKSFSNLQSRQEEVLIVEEADEDEEEEDLETRPVDDSGSSDIPCIVCGSVDRGEVMLICGNESGSVGCGIGTHIDCCSPPLEEVPEGDWFCPNCSSQSKKSTNSSKKRKKGKSK